MLFLLLIFVLTGMSLTVVLWVATLFLQGYYYTEPTEGIAWQAPAAGFSLGLFLTFWCLLLVNDPGTGPGNLPYDTLFRFSPQVEMFKEPVKELWAVKKGVKEPIHFKRLRIDQTRYEYREDSQTRRRWSPNGVEGVYLMENATKVLFKPQPGPEGSGYREFVDDSGWVMKEFPDAGPTGIPLAFRWGRFLRNLFLNFFHLAAWFACLWLLLRFQWPHALGLAFVFWLVMTLAILPMILDQAGTVGLK